jgi:hypothetical protein
MSSFEEKKAEETAAEAGETAAEAGKTAAEAGKTAAEAGETAAVAEEIAAVAEEIAARAEAGEAKVQLVDVLEPMTSYMHDEELAKLMQVSKGLNTGLKDKFTPVQIKAIKDAPRLKFLERVEKTKLVCEAQRELRELDDDEFETKYCHELRETNSKSIIRRHLFLFKKNCDGLPGLLGAPAAIEKFNNLYERRQVELLYEIIKPGMDPPDDRTVSMWVSRRDLLCLRLNDPPSIFTIGAVVKLGVLKNDKQHSKKMAKISSVTLTGNRENGHVRVILNREGWSGQPVIDVGFDEVESLTLNGNAQLTAQLTDLDLDGIEFMKRLRELNLENNQLECLPPIPWVQILNISHNKIKSLKKCHCVDDGLFFSRRDPGNYFQIVELYVNDNQITSLEGVRFPMSLKVLNLRGNPLTCLDKAVFPIGLNTFELDARNVTSLTEFVIPTHLLRSLDFAPEEVLSKYVIMKQDAHQAAYRTDGRRTTSMFLLKTSRLAHAAEVLDLDLVEALPLSNHTDGEVARRNFNFWDSRTEKLIKLREEGFSVAELKALGAEHEAEHVLSSAGYSRDEIHGTSSSFRRSMDNSDSDGGAAGHGNDKEYAQGNTSGRSKSKSSLSHRGRVNKNKTRRRQRQRRQSKRNRKNKYSHRRRSAKSKSK